MEGRVRKWTRDYVEMHAVVVSVMVYVIVFDRISNRLQSRSGPGARKKRRRHRAVKVRERRSVCA